MRVSGIQCAYWWLKSAWKQYAVFRHVSSQVDSSYGSDLVQALVAFMPLASIRCRNTPASGQRCRKNWVQSCSQVEHTTGTRRSSEGGASGKPTNVSLQTFMMPFVWPPRLPYFSPAQGNIHIFQLGSSSRGPLPDQE